MALHDVALFFLALASELVGTVSGFGSSTFFVPGASLVESFQFVLALTAILHLLSNSTRLILFRGHIPFKECIVLAVPAILLTAVGAQLTAKVPVTTLQICLGFALVIIALSPYFISHDLPKFISIGLAGASGLFTGLVGTGGALRAAALRSMRLKKNAFVFASSFIDLGGDAARAGIYLRHGYMDWTQWYYLPLLLIAAVVGSWCGKQILSRIHQTTFERIVTALVLVSGLALIVGHSL